jgi:AcrR family transcriptional regulator
MFLMPPKTRLDREIVVHVAAELANRDGVEALSLHRLAQELQIRTPSLYNHIDGLPGLYRQLALLSANRLGSELAAATVGKSGPQALLALALAYREFIRNSPGLYLAGLRYQTYRAAEDSELSNAEQQVLRVVLAVMASFDLSGEDGLHAVRGLRSMVHGFAILEIAGGFGLPLDCDESFRRLVNMLVRGLEKGSGLI